MAMKKEPPEVERAFCVKSKVGLACYFDHHFYKFVYFSNVKEKPMTFTEQAKDQAQASWREFSASFYHELHEGTLSPTIFATI